MATIGTDPAEVSAHYATTERLSTRAAVWRDTPDGRNPRRAALSAILAQQPSGYVEVGCGVGDVARAVQDALPQCRVLATDASQAMVLATAAKGVVAQVATADALPLDDDSADVVYAGWMLYHVPDLDAALAEVRRVLRPGGTFVAATNGDTHLADLLGEAGCEPFVSQFSSENGETSLRRHFADVAREDFDTRAVFPDHAAARAYLDTLPTAQGDDLPYFDGERTYVGSSTVFVAR